MLGLRAPLVSVVGLAFLSAGCAVEADAEDAPAAADAVTNAEPTAAFPAVAHLLVDGSKGCTATLIAPDQLLTAAHCVYFAGVSVGAWVDGVWYVADRWVMHPSYDPYTANTVGLEGNLDIAVVHLTKSVTGVRPISLAKRAPSSGEAFKVVGYGQTSDGTDGTKRQGTATIGTIHGAWFSGSGAASPCFGDSGGPALSSDGSAVLGVFARMRADCRGGQDGFHYVTVAPLRDWITSAL